ncbi:receptor-type tyrosine-protein phosphatase alpha-like [Littorina saxatilis]|uniref:protein-tyrosine-phosphatase n=1 Tax=Littorina saxatilis TaxID=31220 RepID=A0AAN9BBI7_9CAEN
MAGLSVTVGGQLCRSFPDSSDPAALDNLKENITVTCTPPLIGREVRLQKNGRDMGSAFNFINICEVQVWGCADAYVGPDCQCGHCRDGARCDVTTLECSSGCDRGWRTLFCNQSCPAYKHGYNCVGKCGHCADNDTCNTVTGLCPRGCQPGWKGDDCKQKCDEGKYGINCSLSCGNCSTGDVCHHTNGTCPRGCAAGFDPSDHVCKTNCQNGSYGQNCSEHCGHCSGIEQCNPVNGACTSCQPQFKPPLCKVCTGNRYGASCELNCSANCDGDGSCEQDTGRCVGGCKAGYRPEEKGFCNETCEGGKYGKGCSQECGKCNGVCHHEDGHCEAGCLDGFEGKFCAVSSPGSDVPLIAGLVVGVLALIGLCGVLAVIIIRRRRNKPEAGSAHTRSSAKPEGRQTALSFDPVTDYETPKSTKLSAAVKPMVATKPSNGNNQEDAGHIYYNTADVSAHIQSEPAKPAAPAPASTQGKGQAPASGPPPRTPISTQQVADPADYDEDDNVYYNDDGDVYASFKATQPKLDAVQKYLVDALASGNLKEEFATLDSMPEGVPQEVAQLKKNFKKNRFASILPYDRNLVVMRDGYSEGTATDFVNASYVSGYQLGKQFIAAQGPRDNTVGDLWRMIWQEQITHVVMLTNIQERGKPKCELYWPEEEGGVDTFGPVTVTTTHVQCRDDFFIRTFNVKRAGSAESREVTQYHYVSWPDHGAPTTTSLVTFWRYVHNRTTPADGASVPPVLVHCSAGVGRTGTYIGLEIGVDMAVREGHINVLDLVKRLREQRCLMVQAVDQYVFLHKALLEAYTAHGTNVSVDEFEVIFTGHITSDKPHPRVDKEFQTLQQMLTLTPAHRHDTASLEENVAKNRNASILPSDEHLVYLTEHVSGRNQYTNAVFMPTFRDHRGSIVTQLPLPATLVDFWRLVYGNDVSAIVSLSSPNKEQEVKPYCQYWPTKEGEQLKMGPYFVTLTSKTERGGSKVTSYSLNLGKKGVKSARVVELLHYKGWTGKVGGSTSDILHLIDTLVTLQENTSTDRLVVQCSDGVGKSGLFCALCDIINRMTYDREVDVYMTVRHVQSVTPKALSSVTQYRYCYEVVQNRVREMSVYANAPQR